MPCSRPAQFKDYECEVTPSASRHNCLLSPSYFLHIIAAVLHRRSLYHLGQFMGKESWGLSLVDGGATNAGEKLMKKNQLYKKTRCQHIPGLRHALNSRGAMLLDAKCSSESLRTSSPAYRTISCQPLSNESAESPEEPM
ncbi:unnamed protein product [Pleuronectes platessa]|uniref:Uncharacterized protein n=1 Tax=Pleuronectes platessa TaxID=8262 RepID=A0A9N7YDD5_PLEPL|nr:unnamed protein product [Pleuronectes platessa]